MYIMSQDGYGVYQLAQVEIRSTEIGPGKRIVHTGPDGYGQPVAEYPTEAEATAQLAGIAAALLRGSPIYCFDKAQGGK